MNGFAAFLVESDFLKDQEVETDRVTSKNAKIGVHAKKLGLMEDVGTFIDPRLFAQPSGVMQYRMGGQN